LRRFESRGHIHREVDAFIGFNERYQHIEPAALYRIGFGGHERFDLPRRPTVIRLGFGRSDVRRSSRVGSFNETSVLGDRCDIPRAMQHANDHKRVRKRLIIDRICFVERDPKTGC
jgi:hypothetical protein